jgi:hypothetical protein
MIALTPFVLGLAVATLPSVPWYDRPSCKEVVRLALKPDFEAANAARKSLFAGDVEDKTCGVWSGVVLDEVEISLVGNTPESMKKRDQTLLKLYKFAQKYGSAPHIRDLAIEARVRRIRLLSDKGDKTGAFDEARTTYRMLQERGSNDMTPPLSYAQGIVDMAVSNSGWALRTLMSMAGVKGDEARGRKALKELANGDTAYKYATIYLLRYFADEAPSPENGRPLEYSQTLYQTFPKNPQFVYDYALDLKEVKRCNDALEALSGPRKMLEAAPAEYSPIVRAKLYWLNGYCALSVGDRDTARRDAELAKAQEFDELEDRIEALQDQLGT